MAGICYEKIACNSCGSSNGKQVFIQADGTFDARCFACNTNDRDPYGGNPPTDHSKVAVSAEDRQRVVDSITSDFPIRSIPSRGLDLWVCEHLGIRVAVSQVNGKDITQHYYPSTNAGNIVGYEVRNVNPKSFYALGNRRDIDFFGWEQARQASGKKLFVTEDALSCASIIQAIVESNKGTAYADKMPAVVALPKGAGSAAMMIKRHMKDLTNWSELVLVLDQDTAGLKAEDDIIEMLSGVINVTVVKLPLKDPNDMLMAGRGKELAHLCMWKAKIKRYDGVKDVTDFLEKAITPPQFGISWPWAAATAATFGIRDGEIHIVGAAPKIGKTDHQHQLAEHLVREHGLTVGLFDLENAGSKTLRKVAGKFAKKPFHRPDIVIQEGEIERACMQLDGKIKFYDSSNDKNWDSIKSAIISMNKIDGVRHFFIDPLTALISTIDASSANDELNKIMTELAGLCQRLPATFFLYSHVNPPKTGKPHEEGGRVLSSQFTGSRAMEKWAHYGWGIERNRESEDPNEKNLATVRLLFDREYGNSASFQVWYDAEKNTFLEPEDTGGDY